MPKLFASEIVIHDRETGEKIPARVEVNHPAQLHGHRDLPVELRRRRLQREAQGGADGGSGQALRDRGHHRRHLAADARAGRRASKLTLEYTGAARHQRRELRRRGRPMTSGADVRKVDLRAVASTRAWARPTRPTSQEGAAQRRPEHQLQAARRGRARRASSTTTCCRSTRATARRCSCWACATRRPSRSATCACRPTTRASWTASAPARRAGRPGAARAGRAALRRHGHRSGAARAGRAAGAPRPARALALFAGAERARPTRQAARRLAGDLRFHGSQRARGRARARRRGAGAHPQRRAVRAGAADAASGRPDAAAAPTRRRRPS